MRIPLAIIALALATGPLAGCGYTASDPAAGQTGPTGGLAGYQWKSLYRDDVRTVAVPIFSNRSFRRRVPADQGRRQPAGGPVAL